MNIVVLAASYKYKTPGETVRVATFFYAETLATREAFNAQHITLNVQSEFSELSVAGYKLSIGRFLRLE